MGFFTWLVCDFVLDLRDTDNAVKYKSKEDFFTITNQFDAQFSARP